MRGILKFNITITEASTRTSTRTMRDNLKFSVTINEASTRTSTRSKRTNLQSPEQKRKKLVSTCSCCIMGYRRSDVLGLGFIGTAQDLSSSQLGAFCADTGLAIKGRIHHGCNYNKEYFVKLMYPICRVFSELRI